MTEGNDDLIALDALDHQLAWELDVRELSVYRQGGDRPGELEARIPLAAQ